jgi:formamidopyrimidine-DNA glycosylase
MPELPEVETIKNTLEQLILGKTIELVQVDLPRIIRHPAVEDFQQIIEGKRIEAIKRRGKFLLFQLSDNWTIISHLRMEGNYGLFKSDEPVAKHTHVIFYFTDGTQLRYRDTRQFGTMDLVNTSDVANHKSIANLGIEPLETNFTEQYLYDQITKKQKSIKAVLLDQGIIAGIGNIYADEILFRSKISPMIAANKLSIEDCSNICKNTKLVLKEAIKVGGSSVKSYVNGLGKMGMFQQQLLVYKQNGKPCAVCGSEIQKTRTAGRGTHYCPNCQK